MSWWLWTKPITSSRRNSRRCARLNIPKSLDYVRRGAAQWCCAHFPRLMDWQGCASGTGLGPAELLAYCARMADTFSVSSVAQAAALAAVDDQSTLEDGLEQCGHRPRFSWMSCRSWDIEWCRLAANFLYCDVGEDASGFAGRLRAGESACVRWARGARRVACALASGRRSRIGFSAGRMRGAAIVRALTS